MTTTGDDDAPQAKLLNLRYAGTCAACGAELPAGTRAAYFRATRTVRCLSCFTGEPPPAATGSGAAPGPVSAGGAGASARREYERRSAKREARIREAHPRLGGLILAISEEPRTTTAWARGARGEEILGRNLDGLEPRGVRVLHDRRIPRTRANIDHIAVAPTGVHVIDAKRYKGRPALRAEGGIIRPRVHKLMVGSRNCTSLVEGMHKQLEVVRTALDRAGFTDVPVHGTLCFVDADWPLFGGSFAISDVAVLWPKKLAERLLAPGEVTTDAATAVHASLARAFPVA
ncbi:NERD domain-containing protein [Cellulomonas hominis]|uniref:NERD domain-containing protein n=1 Tax=Cellulomonas hominis TaxID=156981 RepID=A0A7Z8K2I1_9CELL|nr:nuclease-related domain-containing protein [Cellulomonas hominis]TKR26965.1 NERD domain-containing protein [Cellulomonas hominis]